MPSTTPTSVSAAELEAYQARLLELLYSDSPAIFANYSKAHAKCIVNAFLGAAKKKVVILSGDFGSDFYCDETTKKAIIDAVRNDVSVRIVSLNTAEDSRRQLEALQRDAAPPADCKGSFSYRLGVVRPGAKVQHYMVVDSKRYRLEESHDMPAPDTVHAEVCCNGPAKSAFLGQAFEAVWSRLG
jgi:hypothetical protein